MALEWFSVAVAVVTICVALYTRSRASRLKNLPPGPPAFPFLGNLLSFGDRPHVTMTKWKEQYGDVLSVSDGKKPIIILSNYHTVRKVFGDDLTAGRDNTSAIRLDRETMKDGGLIFSEGDLWKTHRRFALTTLRDLGMGKNRMESTIMTEVNNLCQLLRDTKGKPFDPKTPLNNSVSNVMCGLTFGQTFSLDDPEFSRLTRMVTQMVESVANESIAQALPFLVWLPNPVRTSILLGRDALRGLANSLRERVHEHDKIFNKDGDVHDYIDAYQNENERKGVGNETFDETQLVASLADLFAAGTETTSTTTLWGLVFMIENPDVMKKIQDEIDTTVGRETTLNTSHRALLPYTEAAILEIQRAASLVPLGLPHKNAVEMTIDGFTIPKDTIILANLYSIHRDERWWKNPLKFDPYRFLDENMKITRPDGFAPFSIGKRSCLGEALAKIELFLFIANLIRCFDFKLPPGKTLTSDDYLSSVVNAPLPFELIFTPRV